MKRTTVSFPALDRDLYAPSHTRTYTVALPVAAAQDTRNARYLLLAGVHVRILRAEQRRADWQLDAGGDAGVELTMDVHTLPTTTRVYHRRRGAANLKDLLIFMK